MVKVDLPSITRILALLASMAAYFGFNVPESTVESLSMFIFAGLSLYNAYKNNYLLNRGMQQKEVLQKHSLYKR